MYMYLLKSTRKLIINSFIIVVYIFCDRLLTGLGNLARIICLFGLSVKWFPLSQQAAGKIPTQYKIIS